MSSVVIAGNTSGSITISAPDVSGSNTLTLPVATDTLVGKATTDTLTNKTLVNPTITGNLTTTGNTILGDASTDTLNVGNGGLVKDASGNVGIGTSSPVVNLNVAKSSDGVAARFQRSSGGGIVDIETYNGIGGIGTNDNIPFRLNTNNTERVRIDSSGNVGIGTASPAGKLDITGANVLVKATASSGFASFYANGATGSTAYNFFAINGTETARIYSDAGNFLAFATGSSATERMRIDSSGNVGIGTSSPATKLQVSGDVTIYGTPSSTVQGVQFRNLFNTGAHLFSQGAATTNTYINWINANGTVGSIAATGSGVAYNTSSDYRLKENIAPMVGALEKVAILKPVTYKWKLDGSDGQGFIAHELAEVIPNSVAGEKDATEEQEYEISPAIPAVLDEEGVEVTPAVEAVMGTRTVPVYQGIDTSFLVATLTAAIQELKAIVDAQAVRIAALES